MTKQEFLAALASALERIPESERNDIVRDYEEYFIDAQSAGRSDAEVIAQLGQPAQLAKQLIADRHLTHAQNNLTFATFLKATLAVVSLTFFNLVFILGPLIGVVGVLFGMWVTSISFILTPLIYFVSLAFNLPSFGTDSITGVLQQSDLPQHIQQALVTFGGFITITASGIGLLGCVVLYYISRWFIRIFIRYMQANVSILRGSTKS
jgi:uncharacterized membrane protein